MGAFKKVISFAVQLSRPLKDLTLKDKTSELRCVFFKHINIYLGFRLQDGMHIQIFGGVSIYEQRGQLQFLIQRLKKSGLGVLYQEYQALKNKLECEGLFLNECKKQILDFSKDLLICSKLLEKLCPKWDIMLEEPQEEETP